MQTVYQIFEGVLIQEVYLPYNQLPQHMQQRMLHDRLASFCMSHNFSPNINGNLIFKHVIPSKRTSQTY